MPEKKILEAAGKLFKSAPSLRGGLVMGLQLVRDSLQLTEEQKQEINQAIDIISGVSNYRKPAPRPSEIKKIEDRENEANEPVTASEPEAKTLPRREDPLDIAKNTITKRIPSDKPNIANTPKTDTTPEPEKEEPKKDTIRRPWDKDPNVIRRPKRR